MNSATLNPRRWRSRTVGSESERGDYISAIAGLAGLLLFSLDTIAPHWVTMAQMQNDTTHNSNTRDTREVGGVESLIAGYVGNPIYYRSNINLVRPDGTDLKLKGLG